MELSWMMRLCYDTCPCVLCQSAQWSVLGLVRQVLKIKIHCGVGVWCQFVSVWRALRWGLFIKNDALNSHRGVNWSSYLAGSCSLKDQRWFGSVVWFGDHEGDGGFLIWSFLFSGGCLDGLVLALTLWVSIPWVLKKELVCCLRLLLSAWNMQGLYPTYTKNQHTWLHCTSLLFRRPIYPNSNSCSKQHVSNDEDQWQSSNDHFGCTELLLKFRDAVVKYRRELAFLL